ncbi:hypothetical protein M569_08171, partial [Genlisea aurea]
MKCFPFYNGEKRESPKPSSTLSSYTDREARSCASEIIDASDSSIGSNRPPQFPEKFSDLRVFTFLELKQATRNFSMTAKLGEGGFGSVYKGIIRNPEDPTNRIVAVKQLNTRGLQGHKEWVTEVNVLGIVEHPNLVKLVGYCAEDHDRGIHRLLVYEFMPNGSVEDHLSSRSLSPLSWDMRLKIALDAACGLAYLHEEMSFQQIIFRDFKSSNILLDDQWNAKLSDFGLARLGPSDGRTHISTQIVGTLGYAAPEYVQTGRLRAKSDIWSYGVFLYELITGRRPLDHSRPRNEQKLLEWIKPYLSDPKKFQLVVDHRLPKQRQVLKSAHRLSLLANRCLSRRPKARPSMSEVREVVREIIETSTGIRVPPQIPLISS